MTGTNQYPPFATGASPLVLSPDAYANLPARTTGWQIGEVDPEPFNTPFRLASVPAAALAQIICDHALLDAVDDGSYLNFKANLRIGLAAMLATAYEAADTSQAANTIIAALDPAPPSLNGYYKITVKVANTNTGPTQANFNGVGLRPVFRRDGTPVQSGDLRQGQYVELIGDGAEWFMAGAARSEIAAMIAASGAPGPTDQLSPATLALLSKTFTQAGDTSGYAANATNTVQLQNASVDFGTMANGVFTFTKSGLYVVSYDFFGSVSLGAQSTVGFFSSLRYTPNGGSAIVAAPQGITAGPANPVGASQSSGMTRQFNAGDTLAQTFYVNTGSNTVNAVTVLAATNMTILRVR